MNEYRDVKVHCKALYIQYLCLLTQQNSKEIIIRGYLQSMLAVVNLLYVQNAHDVPLCDLTLCICRIMSIIRITPVQKRMELGNIIE